MGSMRLMLSKKFWTAPIRFMTKFSFMTGFLFYLHHPLVILLSLHLFWSLFIYNEVIPQSSSLLFFPHIVFSLVYVFMFPIAKTPFRFFNIVMARTYAYTHAVKTAILGKTVGWIPTNARHSTVSPAFREVTTWVGIYTAISLLFVASGIRGGFFHPIDTDYYTIQFWILFNFVLTAMLLVSMVSITRNIGGTWLPKTFFYGIIPVTVSILLVTL